MFEDDDALLADLPPLRDDEPASLRQDIVDELADHLACAFHRELVKSGDEQTARKRVLDRFGNPMSIASRLWFQAMWSRIMLQRVAFGISTALLMVLLVVSVLLIQGLNQLPTSAQLAQLNQQNESNRQMLSTLLARLPQNQPQPVTPFVGGAMGSGMGGMDGGLMMGGMEGGSEGGDLMLITGGGNAGAMPSPEASATSLTLRLIMNDAMETPAAGCTVGVYDEHGRALISNIPPPLMGAGSGMMMPGGMGSPSYPSTAELRQHPGEQQPVLPEAAQGELRYSQIDPGRFTIYIEFPDGRALTRRIAIRPRAKHEERIVCPLPVEKIALRIDAPPLPEDLRTAGLIPIISLVRQEDPVGENPWKMLPQTLTRLTLSAVDGQATSTSRHVMNSDDPAENVVLSDFPPEERFVVLPAGTYTVATSFEWPIPDHDQPFPGGLTQLMYRVPEDSEVFRRSKLAPGSHLSAAVSNEVTLGVTETSAEDGFSVTYPDEFLKRVRDAMEAQRPAAKSP